MLPSACRSNASLEQFGNQLLTALHRVVRLGVCHAQPSSSWAAAVLKGSGFTSPRLRPPSPSPITLPLALPHLVVLLPLRRRRQQRRQALQTAGEQARHPAAASTSLVQPSRLLWDVSRQSSSVIEQRAVLQGHAAAAPLWGRAPRMGFSSELRRHRMRVAIQMLVRSTHCLWVKRPLAAASSANRGWKRCALSAQRCTDHW